MNHEDAFLCGLCYHKAVNTPEHKAMVWEKRDNVELNTYIVPVFRGVLYGIAAVLTWLAIKSFIHAGEIVSESPEMTKFMLDIVN